MPPKQSAKQAKENVQHLALHITEQGTEVVVAQLQTIDDITKVIISDADRLAMGFSEVSIQLKATQAAIKQLEAQAELNKQQQEELKTLIEQEALLRRQLTTEERTLNQVRNAGTDIAKKAFLQQEQQWRREIELLGARARLYGDVESRTRAILSAGTAIGGTGALSQAAFIGTDLMGAVEGFKLLRLEGVELVKQMGFTVAQFTAVAAGAGILTGGLFLLYQQLQDNKHAAEEYRKELEARLTEEEKRSAFLARASQEDAENARDEAQQRRDDAQRNIELYEEQQATLQAVGDEYDRLMEQVTTAATPEEIAAIQEQIADLFPLTVGDETITDIKQLDSAMRVLGKRLDLNEDVVTQADAALIDYNAALASGTLVSEEAKEAREELSKTTRRLIDIEIDHLARMREARKANELSLEEFGDTLEDLREEQTRIIETADQLRMAEDAGRISAEELEAALFDLGIEFGNNEKLIREYQRSFGFFGNAIEDIVDILQDFNNNQANIIKRGVVDMLENTGILGAARSVLEDSRQALADFQQDWEDFLIDWQRAEEDFQLARERDLEAHYIKLGQIDQKFAEQIANVEDQKRQFEEKARQDDGDALREFLKKERRELEDHRDRLLQIRERMNMSIREASAKLDAFAIWQAKQRAEQEEREEKREYQKEKRRRLEDFRDQQRQAQRERREKLRDYNQRIRDLRTQHQRERAEAIRAFERQQRIERENHETRLRRMREDFVREWTLTNEAFKDRYLTEFWWWSQLNLQASNSMEAFVNTVSTGLGSISAGQAHGAAGDALTNLGNLYGFARGGRFTGTALVGEQGPEIIRSLSPMRVTPTGRAPANVRLGGVTNNFNNTGNFTHRYLEIVATKAAAKVVDKMLGKR